MLNEFYYKININELRLMMHIAKEETFGFFFIKFKWCLESFN